jgi:hypothetical protein
MQKYQIDLKGASSQEPYLQIHLWNSVSNWVIWYNHSNIGFRVFKLTKHD